MLRLCHEAGLVRLGLVALGGTKVGADAALDANRVAGGIDEQVTRMLAEAETIDAQEDGQLRDAPPPRGRKPKTMTARERMQRKLRT